MYLRDDSEKVLDRNIGDRVDALLDDSDELLIILGGHLSIRKGMVRGMIDQQFAFYGERVDRTFPQSTPTSTTYI